MGDRRLLRALAGGVAVPVAMAALLSCTVATDPLPTRSQPTGGAATQAPAGGEAAPSPTVPAPVSGLLSPLDRRTCEGFVAERGAAYAWLLRLERRGDVPIGEFEAGRRDLLTMAVVAQTTFIYQTESPTLLDAMQSVVREGQIVADALTSGSPVDPVPLRTALDAAAATCAQGGVPIKWYGP